MRVFIFLYLKNMKRHEGEEMIKEKTQKLQNIFNNFNDNI